MRLEEVQRICGRCWEEDRTITNMWREVDGEFRYHIHEDKKEEKKIKVGMYKIQIVGSEENKDKGFYSIMTSGQSASCLRDEMFFVNEVVVMKLKQDKIEFKILQPTQIIGGTRG